MTRALVVVVALLVPSLAQAEPLIISQTAFGIVQGLDLHSTYKAVQSGHGREINTWALGDGFGAKALVVKSVTTVGVVLATSYLERQGKRKTARVVLWSVTAGMALIVRQNYRVAEGPQ